MKNVTKANVLFTTTVLVYIILVYTIRLLPAGIFSFNALLVLPEIILLLPSVAYLIFLRKDALENTGYQKVSFFTSSMTVLFIFCMIPVVTLINLISSLFVENNVDDTLSYTVASNPWFVNLILIALIPAVVEEFIFRGLIFGAYKKRNPLVAAVLSALLFGLIHMNINQFTYAFVLGIIFALLTYVTGSIIPSTIAHFVINGSSVILTHLITYLQSMTPDVETTVGAEVVQISDEMVTLIAIVVYIGMSVVGIALGSVIFYFICKKNRGFESFKMIFKKPVRTTFDDKQGRFFDGYFALGVGICVLYILANEIILPLLNK